MLERSLSELKYCFACFDWFVEEEWDRHCLTHLRSIASKRCASITHCNTLFRPAFCPFCLGDVCLLASSRWTSWTREAKLWEHLKTHLVTVCWPRQCPHPSYSLEIESETSFLYHLHDIHHLQMSASLQRSWSNKHDRKELIWTPEGMSQQEKRKRHTRALRPRRRPSAAGPARRRSPWTCSPGASSASA